MIQLITDQRRWLDDMKTPVAAFHQFTRGSNRFLLESVAGSGQRGRYSIIGSQPMLIFKHFKDYSVIEDKLLGTIKQLEGDPFDHIRQILTRYQFPLQQPFACGLLCGYLSYDTIRYIERIPDKNPEELNLPEMMLIVPSELIVFDNYDHTITFYLHQSADNYYKELMPTKIDNYMKNSDFNNEISSNLSINDLDVQYDQVLTDFNHREYFERVARAKEYIRQGDIFQVVLSRRFRKTVKSDSFRIYRYLRYINPSPYLFYFEFDGFQLVGSSPETMVNYDGRKVLVRPIAGTRKRGESQQEDRQLAAELLNDEKELAEHVMLVDLARNDMGRIARYGSVKVDEFEKVEPYSHVMHIVSTVTGELREKCDCVDIFRACFPAGTVSGAPKIRAMEIIDELEPVRRGIYAGAVGYFDFSGRMDTCIAIRTMVLKEGMAYWQAGGGIVADSVPTNELAETDNKGRAILKALLMSEEEPHDCNY